MAELSGLEVLALLKEINSGLRGSYVNNVYSLGESQLIRLRKPENGDSWLVVSPSKGVWLSEKVAEREETMEFTSKLRKELGRARFVGASQEDLDRIFKLDFAGEAPKTLIVEMMPPGNIIVTEGDGKIVLIKNEVRSQSRRLFRGGSYRPPAQTRLSPMQVGAEDVAAMLKSESTVGRALGKHVALPRKYISETTRRMSVSEGDPAESLAGRESEVVSTIRELVEEASARPTPSLVASDTGKEVLMVRPRGVESEEVRGTLSSLCDSLFLGSLAGEQKPGPEEARRLELEATAAKLQEREKELESQAENLRSLAQAASQARSFEEASKFLAQASVDPGKGLNSAAAVASTLFDRAKEAEKRASEARASAEKLQKRALRVRSQAVARTRQLTSRRQEWYERFRWFSTSEGRLAVGGRDSQTNSLVLKRHMDKADIVFHADVHGSPFFVLKGGSEKTEQEVREVAQATVSFSSAWKTGLGSADAYWVTPDQISSAAPSGEYLPRGSFAITGKKNFVNRNLVEISVGVDGSGRVVSGPESAVRKPGVRYVVLRPHREKSSETAKKVLSMLAVSAGEGSGPTLDEVLRALPSGGGKIVRRAGL